MKINEEKLIEKAFEAMENSYSKYSNFKVGASILTTKGDYIIGTNVENISFGLTNCAERSALFTAYSMGLRKDDIVAMAVVTKDENLTTPCGACRQVMGELINPDTPIYLSNGKEKLLTNMLELLPLSFKTDTL